MALVGPVFLDTTILLGGSIEFTPGGDDCHRVMAALAAARLPGARTAWHCCLEFVSVATRLPEEYRLEPADARLLLEEEILPRLEVHGLPRDHHLEFLRSAALNGVRGGRIYDRHIGAVAHASGARSLVTENVKHFNFLSGRGVRLLRARDLLADLRSA